MEIILIIISLIGIGIFDSLDPIPFIVIIGILSKKKWLTNFLYFIIPYWTLYFILGVLMLVLGDNFKQIRFLDSYYINYILNSVDVLFICYGVYKIFTKIKKKSAEKKELDKDSGIKYLLLSVILIVSNMPFAYPYFIIISELVVNKVTLFYSIFYIFIYTLSFIFPYIFFVWAYRKYENKAKIITDKVINFITNKYIVGTVLIVLGCYLLFCI